MFGGVFDWMLEFNEEKLKEGILLNHLLLNFGISIGYFLRNMSLNLITINPYFVLMIADAMAAIFGRKFG